MSCHPMESSAAGGAGVTRLLCVAETPHDIGAGPHARSNICHRMRSACAGDCMRLSHTQSATGLICCNRVTAAMSPCRKAHNTAQTSPPGRNQLLPEPRMGTSSAAHAAPPRRAPFAVADAAWCGMPQRLLQMLQSKCIAASAPEANSPKLGKAVGSQG